MKRGNEMETKFNPKTLTWETPKAEFKIKVVKLYSVRYYPDVSSNSERVGWKGTLRQRSVALKLVKRLKKFGIDAFCVPMMVSIMVPKV